MHKTAKVVLSISICFLLSAFVSLVYAASIGDTIEPLGNLKLAINGEYNGVFDRDLGGTISNDATAGDFSSGELDRANQAFVKAAIGITDNLNVFAKFGGADSKLKLKENDGTLYNIETDFGFIGGGGIDASLDIYEGLRLGADVQAFLWSSDIDTLRYNGEAARNIKGDFGNYEFQTAVYLSKKLEPDTMGMPVALMPYFGGLYSMYRTVSDGNITFNVNSGAVVAGFDLEEDNNFGIVLGTNVYLTDKIVGNLEGRFTSETALSAGLTYRF